MASCRLAHQRAAERSYCSSRCRLPTAEAVCPDGSALLWPLLCRCYGSRQSADTAVALDLSTVPPDYSGFIYVDVLQQFKCFQSSWFIKRLKQTSGV